MTVLYVILRILSFGVLAVDMDEVIAAYKLEPNQY